ncbi:MAG: MucBP domain-containing protein [Streptococcus mitis]|nr:MucBP domain-containing protein [Streptococcus mitis]
MDATGKVTFKPEQEFTGTADGITVVRKDKLGKTISAQYTPTVRPDTEFVDENGNPIKGYPSEDGTTPKKDNVPEYRFVETKKLPNGDTEHIYEKVTTFFKDKDGKELPNTPSEKGIFEKKDVPDYKFLETKKLPNGDIEHVYEKVVTPTSTPTPFEYKVITTFVDENGNPILPNENGEVPAKDIPGYELVRTEKEAEAKQELPNTGTEANASLAALGLLARKKKED